MRLHHLRRTVVLLIVGAAAAGTTVAVGQVAADTPEATGATAPRTFYVAKSGSNANPGTAARPWRTVQKALNTLRPGQRALARAGTYRENLSFDRAATASAPIVVQTYPRERASLSSAGGHPLEVGSSGAHLRLLGLTIERSPGTSGGNVDVYGHHILLSGNDIRLGVDQGIYTAEGSHHVRIVGNRIHHNGKGRTHQSHGIYLQGNDHRVVNNVIHDHPEGFGIQVYDRNSRSVVAHNTVVRSGHSGVVVGGSGGVDRIRIFNNIFAFNSHYGIETDSTCPKRTLADHNVLHGNAWGPIEGSCSGLSTSGGNFTGSPRFVDFPKRNLHLSSGSSAINRARRDWSSPRDRDGQRRPQGRGPDVGAYEDS